MVARKYDELEIEKTYVEIYSYLEKFLGETTRAVWEAYKLNYLVDCARNIEFGQIHISLPIKYKYYH